LFALSLEAWLSCVGTTTALELCLTSSCMKADGLFTPRRPRQAHKGWHARVAGGGRHPSAPADDSTETGMHTWAVSSREPEGRRTKRGTEDDLVVSSLPLQYEDSDTDLCWTSSRRLVAWKEKVEDLAAGLGSVS